MVQKKINNLFLITLLLLLFGCGHQPNNLFFYKFQDRIDCDYCFPAYCFFYDTAFHYTAIQYGFYENDDGFLRDTLYFESLRDSIKAEEIPPTHYRLVFDSIKCYCEYPSHWRFTFEMYVSKHGECDLLLYSPYYLEGEYRFMLTSLENRLVNYSACQLSTQSTGFFMAFDKRPHVPGDPVYFVILLYHGSDIYSYIGDQDADNVPDEVFFFRDAMGAIAQNHFSRLKPTIMDTNHQSISDELSRVHSVTFNSKQ